MGRQLVGAENAAFSYIYAMKLRATLLFAAVLAVGAFPAQGATGANGAILNVSPTSGVKAGQLLTVTGKKFDMTVGIYVELCEVVPAGTLPTVCGGGVNMSGTGAASFWISSNPPSYGRNLAIPFKSGGTFSVGLKVQPIIGKIDCRKVSCAVYVRADHTRTQDRTHDIKVPITFSK